MSSAEVKFYHVRHGGDRVSIFWSGFACCRDVKIKSAVVVKWDQGQHLQKWIHTFVERGRRKGLEGLVEEEREDCRRRCILVLVGPEILLGGQRC